MKSIARAAVGAVMLLSGCGKPAPTTGPAPAPEPGMIYSCVSGQSVRAAYAGLESAVVTYGDESWNMTSAGKPGRYAAQGRQWQVSAATDHEEGVLSAVSGGQSAVIARCSRSGPLSPVAANLPPPSAQGACTAADLSLKFVSEDAGAGQRYDQFAVANRGQAACSVQGFAQMTLLGDDGLSLRNFTVTQSLTEGPGSGPAQRIDLKPGEQAVFYLHWTPIQSGEETCPHVSRVRVVAPGGKVGLIPLDATPCGGHAQQSPLRKPTG